VHENKRKDRHAKLNYRTVVTFSYHRTPT